MKIFGKTRLEYLNRIGMYEICIYDVFVDDLIK